MVQSTEYIVQNTKCREFNIPYFVLCTPYLAPSHHPLIPNPHKIPIVHPLHPMQFSLQTLLLILVVVAAAVGLFGVVGMVISVVVLACAGYIRMSKDSEMAFYNVVVALIISFPFLCRLVFPALVTINDAIVDYFQLGNNHGLTAYAEPREFSSSPLDSPVWKVFFSLTILIGATVLIVRRPLPVSDEDRMEQEEEIRLEDTSEPEVKSNEK